jgi:hypothetical protein
VPLLLALSLVAPVLAVFVFQVSKTTCGENKSIADLIKVMLNHLFADIGYKKAVQASMLFAYLILCLRFTQ